MRIFGSENLELVEAFLLPSQLSLIGNHSSWPPRADVIASDFEAVWKARRPAEGMVVKKAEDGAQAGLVLHLRREDPSQLAGFENIEVSYVADGVHYVAESTIAFGAKRRC
ncbi:hypothetical protein [Nocardioides sp. 503]|uniref:hypothetical protein n=1 Tax=Nocardioides sp. 503 TaxID=2508326 RepID=UPI0010703F87|nr:hypothetical protein [Nocardioides sp. 503]